MTINFIPNDPRATQFKLVRNQPARPQRPAARADFVYAPAPPEGLYAPGTAPFLFWQTREAALATLDMFEGVQGAGLTRWARSTQPKKLRLDPDLGQDLNAYYDGESVSFFHYPIGTKTVFSGESTDVVSHEVGHALLDALRPELWSATYLEAGAFHEAFGDCVAILTALADRDVRLRLVQSVQVAKANFVEKTAEDLSWAIGQINAAHNAAKARRGHNTYQWTLPSNLPDDGGPGVLINEVHSFAQIFTGCFYDLVGLLYADRPTHTEIQLRNAATVAAKLLFSAAGKAPLTPRFFQSIGRTMALEDQALFNGVHRQRISEAFANHGIVLGSNAMVAERSALSGTVRAGNGATASLSKQATGDVRRRLGAAPGQKIAKRALKVGGSAVTELTHQRPVDLTGLAGYLKGVQATGTESLLISATGKKAGAKATTAKAAASAAVMSAVPDAAATENEVRQFVAGLVARGQISHNGAGTRRTGAVARAAQPSRATAGFPITHRVVSRAGTKVLERQRFACGCRPTGVP